MSEDRSVEWIEYTRVNAEVTKAKEKIVTELGLSIIINGKHFTTAMITPMMEKEFVIGHLFGQGIIENIDNIASITVKDNIAEVTLPRKEVKAKWSSEIHSDFKVSREDIFNGVNAILKSKIYAETEAIHSAGLFKRGAEPVCIAEDVGRHNALDKVIGHALINKIDFKNTFAASTGRMVSDMVSKICRANIPIVATKTAVTKLGVEIGERCGLTIVGFVRDIGTKVTKDNGVRIAIERGMKIYTSPQRILFDATERPKGTTERK
ncbi:MAG TPA: formate dehydrogenase accessory sulfurtransferase FdhD [Dehalococcoidia bacterium]|nr:formate dehydrogenase accessory sulfurtransferase FdhD [Dehalococcoidia bacterium]